MLRRPALPLFALAAAPYAVLAQAAPADGDAPLLDSLLRTIPVFRDSVAPRAADFELQVLYRPLTGPDSGRTLTWGHAPARYFYPASTVKLPVAALALERLADLGFPADVVLEVDSVRAPQSTSRERVGLPGAPATVAGHVRDLGIASSNEAYNRLFEWLGPRAINRELHARGLATRIVHRVGVGGFDAEENRHLPPVRLLAPGTGDTLLTRAATRVATPYELAPTNQRKGVGRYDDEAGAVVDEPFDFATKNFLALADLAAVLQAVVAPQTVAPTQRFALRAADRELLLAALSTRPADSDNPLHRDRPDGYVNFLYYGGGGPWEADGPLIRNKVGDAYGTLTDAAAFSDPATGRPLFVLAATVLVNANGIYNDGVYEYEGIGFPLLRELGRGVWALWRGR